MTTRRVLLFGVTVGTALFTTRATHESAPNVAEDFTETVITRELDTPWDMAWGPDGMIWVSERGGRISRVDPNSGARSTAGTVAGVEERGEGGLMGIAFHPDFAHQPFLFAMHTYAGPGGTNNKLVRMRVTGETL